MSTAFINHKGQSIGRLKHQLAVVCGVNIADTVIFHPDKITLYGKDFAHYVWEGNTAKIIFLDPMYWTYQFKHDLYFPFFDDIEAICSNIAYVAMELFSAENPDPKKLRELLPRQDLFDHAVKVGFEWKKKTGLNVEGQTTPDIG